MANHVPELEGDRVRLRPFRRSDIAGRLALGRSPEIVRCFGGNADDLPPFSENEARQWVERNLAHPLCWAVEVDGRLLGEARLDGLNSHDRRARLAAGLYDVSQLGRGLGREAIGLVLSHAFGALALHRIDLRVLAFNERAIRCYRACGFIAEGCERESARIGEQWHDDIIMGLLAKEFCAGVARQSEATTQTYSSNGR
ncbi:GNAT family N-acetyltransferase [Cereibacter changlensis JA139]|uniref:GNAT family N-acetyltransferase n=1 Tax=Cereibacter changlensis JA139 TaxID=1188249 RepID=A0A2T4JI61_9RHOB|nr:GNAT family protein [Cereibacter changlensis]PTE17543.1 GNAT family N-acetyltransferase [Cereibacter changlensis JA139]